MKPSENLGNLLEGRSAILGPLYETKRQLLASQNAQISTLNFKNCHTGYIALPRPRGVVTV